jgi:hypothetical protein
MVLYTVYQVYSPLFIFLGWKIFRTGRGEFITRTPKNKNSGIYSISVFFGGILFHPHEKLENSRLIDSSYFSSYKRNWGNDRNV